MRVRHRTATVFKSTVPALFLAVVLMLPSGTGRAAGEPIETIESLYNTILIFRRGDHVTLSFGYNKRLYTESVYNTANKAELPVTYTRYMTAALAYVPEARALLEIGFGGGRTAWYLHSHRPDAAVTSVELDPEVIRMAKKYFDIEERENFTVAQGDGRIFLLKTDRRYDMIMIDAYRGPFVPFHLLTREFYELVKRRLADGGVVAQNIEPTTMLFDAAAVTLKAVFDQVEFFVAGGNVVSIAYDGERRSQDALMAAAGALQQEHGFYHPLPEMLSERRLLAEFPDREPLTDDFAPVESLKAIEQHNRKWLDPETGAAVEGETPATGEDAAGQ